MRFARLVAASAALTIVAGGFLAGASADPGPDWHDGPHYSVNTDDKTVTATGSVTGVGNGDLTFELNAVVFVSCTNKGGNDPKGHQKTVSGTKTYTDVKNGRVDFEVSTAPIDKKCPGKMTPHITIVSASLTVSQDGAVVLTDTATSL